MKTNLIFAGMVTVIVVVAIVFYNKSTDLAAIALGVTSIANLIYGFIKGDKAEKNEAENEAIKKDFQAFAGKSVEEFRAEK